MVNTDQAKLILQMIIAQHADKTWGEICEIFGLIANVKDENIKMKDSCIRQLYDRRFVVDSKQSRDYLFRFNEEDTSQFVCYSQTKNCVGYVTISLEKLLSIISFEDKV